MLDNELLIKVLNKTLSYGGEYADIFVENKRPTSIQLEDNRIEKVISGVDSGVGIRLIFNGKTLYAFSNDLSGESLLQLADTISKAVGSRNVKTVMDLSARKPLFDFPLITPPSKIAIDKKTQIARLANNISRGFSKKIKQTTVVYHDSVQQIQIASSDGTVSNDERIHTVIVVNVIAADNGIMQTGYESAGGFIGFELFSSGFIEELALKASRRAVMMLSAPRAHGGKMPVVISSEAGGTMIHEAIGHGLEADLAQQGLSVYSGKLGEKVASSLVTVIDDATIPNKRGSFRFDDEGTPARKTVLVNEGLLQNYMYDKLSALKDGTESTANGRRESYRNRPIPRMTNTFIVPGSANPEDVLKSVAKGIFVKKMGGGQVNTVTGDFVFDVQEGYIIESGSIGELIRGATLSGNGPDVLKSIDMVSSDLGFSIGTCGKDSQGVPVSDAMPTIRIPEMVVGGEI